MSATALMPASGSDDGTGLLKLMAQSAPDAQVLVELSDLTNRLAPQEVAAIYARLRDRSPKEEQMRMSRMAPMWTVFQSRGAKTYAREVLGPGATLYRSAVQATQRGAVVCFTDVVGQMFTPNCRFLELLGDAAIDVVILQSPVGTFWTWEFGGGRSLYASFALLRARLAERGIRPLAWVGASSGGIPALGCAFLDAQSGGRPAQGLALAGRFFIPGSRVPIKDAGHAFDAICGCLAGQVPQITNIYGADMRIDVEQNAFLAGRVPGLRSYTIPKDSKHNPMISLGARQKLRFLMAGIAEIAQGRTADFSEVTVP